MTTIKLRRGTAAQWASANPVLAEGEPGLDTTNDVLKVGDGSTAWASLSPAQSGTYADISKAAEIARVSSAGGGFPEMRVLQSQRCAASAAIGTSKSWTFRGLPTATAFASGRMYRLRMVGRNNSSGGRGYAELAFIVIREGGSASITAGPISNPIGSLWGVGTGTLSIALACATDGSTVTVTITNNHATASHQWVVELDAFMPSEESLGYACWGDSLTAGGSTSYPGTLAALTGATVVNLGVGGEHTPLVAARADVIRTTLTTEATIPATGAVNVVTSSGVPSAGNTTAIACVIGGVAGTLNRSGGNQVFTRTQAGAAITFPAGTEVVFTRMERLGHFTHILWTGRNDDAATGSVPLMQGFAARVRSGRTLALSILNSSSEPSGSTGHTGVLAANAAIAAAFGDRYLDVRSYLIASGLTDAGITPTAQDLLDIAADVVPSSLRTDAIHLTNTAYGLVGTQVYNKLVALGWA